MGQGPRQLGLQRRGGGAEGRQSTRAGDFKFSEAQKQGEAIIGIQAVSQTCHDVVAFQSEALWKSFEMIVDQCGEEIIEHVIDFTPHGAFNMLAVQGGDDVIDDLRAPIVASKLGRQGFRVRLIIFQSGVQDFDICAFTLT